MCGYRKQKEVKITPDSIIFGKGAIHRTEIERLFIDAKGFDTNLVQFLPPYHVINSNVHIGSFPRMISHMHRNAPKMVLCAQNLCKKNFNL